MNDDQFPAWFPKVLSVLLALFLAGVGSCFVFWIWRNTLSSTSCLLGS